MKVSYIDFLRKDGYYELSIYLPVIDSPRITKGHNWVELHTITNGFHKKKKKRIESTLRLCQGDTRHSWSSFSSDEFGARLGILKTIDLDKDLISVHCLYYDGFLDDKYVDYEKLDSKD